MDTGRSKGFYIVLLYKRNSLMVIFSENKISVVGDQRIVLPSIMNFK